VEYPVRSLWDHAKKLRSLGNAGRKNTPTQTWIPWPGVVPLSIFGGARPVKYQEAGPAIERLTQFLESAGYHVGSEEYPQILMSDAFEAITENSP